MMSATLQHVGTKYLQMTLRKIVQEVCFNNPKLEIDPLKLKPEDDYDENLKRLTYYCELFFNTITKSIEDCPVFIRHVCEYVQMSAVRKFPDSKQIRHHLSAVGGLLFLRFFCPAIFTPHKFSIVENAPGPIAVRSLILISKVMQIMANGLRFSDKSEQYMMPMNDFIDKHAAELLQFFTDASTVPSEDEIARLEQKQRQSFQERVLKDISNPNLIKNERIQNINDWKAQNAALLSPKGRRVSDLRSEKLTSGSSNSGLQGVPLGSSAKSAPELIRELDQAEVRRNDLIKSLPQHEEKKVSEATERKEDSSNSAASEQEKNENQVTQANSDIGGVNGSGEGHILPKRDDREQRAAWLDVIHFYLSHNLSKIRTLMQNPDLIDDFRHLEKVLSEWTVPEIETEEQKRDKERKERERKEKQKEKELLEKRDRELIELPHKDPKDKENALEKATRRLLKRHKNKGEQESEVLSEDGEDLERLVTRLKSEKEKEEELRKHAEKEKENLKKAKEMIEKELIALIEDSKKMRTEIATLQKDRELIDHWRSEAEKEKERAVTLLEEKHQLLTKIARLSEEKIASDSTRNLLEAERDQMQRERRNASDRIQELEAALKSMTEEREELKEMYRTYEERMKAEERARAKKVRERLNTHDSEEEAKKQDASSSGERTKLLDKHKRKKGGDEANTDDISSSTSKKKDKKETEEKEKKERRKNRRTLQILQDADETDDVTSSSSSSNVPTAKEYEDKDDKKKDKDKKKKVDSKKKEKEKDRQIGSHSLEMAPVSEQATGEAEADVGNLKGKRNSKRLSLKKVKEELFGKELEDKDREKDKRSKRTSFKKSKDDSMADLRMSDKTTQDAQDDHSHRRGGSSSEGKMFRSDESAEKRPIKRTEKAGNSSDEDEADSKLKSKAGSYVAPRKSRDPLRKSEGTEMQRSRSFDALAAKESRQTVFKQAGKPDLDLKEVGKRMKRQLEFKVHKHNLKRFEHCFKGTQAVDWVLQAGNAESRAEAVEICRHLLAMGDIFVSLPGFENEFVDDERYYQFV